MKLIRDFTNLVTLSWLEEETGKVRMQEEAEIRDSGRRLRGAHSSGGVLFLPRSEGRILRAWECAQASPSLLLSFLDTSYQYLGHTQVCRTFR